MYKTIAWASLRIAACVLLLGTSSSMAQVISVNFASSLGNPAGPATNPAQTRLGTTTVAGVVPTDNWFDANFGSGNGVFNNVAGTTLDFSTSMSYDWSQTSTPANPTETLLNGIIGQTNGTGTVTISDIPFPLYDVIFYFTSDQPESHTHITRAGLNDGNTVDSRYATFENATSFVEAVGTSAANATEFGSYARWNGLTADSITLELEDGGGQDANNNSFGFQIVAVAVPEPGSIAIWSLLALGLAGFSYRHVWRTR